MIIITEYVYTADGTKLKTIHRTAVDGIEAVGSSPELSEQNTHHKDSTLYVGAYEISTGLKRYKYNFANGYVDISGAYVQSYNYFAKDHLGNVRHVAYNIPNRKSSILQKNNYYPFGGLHNEGDNRLSQNKLYNGKEYDPMHGLNLYDFSALQYDPALCQFTSPDPYVQAPDFTQNFNRFSYCLNNPLKYYDKSGKFAITTAILIGAYFSSIMNWGMHGMEFNAKGLASFGIGAFAGAVGAGVGAGVNVAMAGGSFWSGAAGLASGVSSTGALAGAVSSASAGFAGGFITGAGNSWNSGGKFGEGLMDGLKSGGIGALSGGITGGVMGGIDALDKGTNFWTGKAELSIEGAYSCSEYGSVVARQMEKSAQKFVLGKYVGKYEGVNVFETDMLGTFNEGTWAGYTLPGHGIVVAKGVFTLGLKGDVGMMQHEFGHILQARKIGTLGYYSIIAPESMHSAATNSVNGHREFWTEKWANYMSKNYFGSSWNVVVYVDKNNYYPVMDGYKIYLQKYNALLRSFIYPPHLPY